MKKFFFYGGLALVCASTIFSCQQQSLDEVKADVMTKSDKALVASAGFNSQWVKKNTDGTFLVEGDMHFTTEELQKLTSTPPSHNFVVANEEHYRTTNVVSVPSSGQRTITVRLGSGFPTYYSPALDAALARYNSLNLRIRFQRVSSGGNIVISGADLGPATAQGCTLGQASGFPSGGNPSGGFTLSTNSCATSSISTQNKADEVMAHEIGHCIGFRHTDYANRASCGGPGEGAGTIGAVFIPGTVGTVTASYNSWMMACTNSNPAFSSTDGVALNFVY